MPRIKIDYDDYRVKAFLDSNIILECRPLDELPWAEIHPEGPIIALITPTALKEIDSKKQDGRIGRRARTFNRLISQVAAGGAPIVIREIAPRVELALCRAARIPWDQYDDLDPDDGDSCIVAEALHAKDMNANDKLIVSHDIKPIAFASYYSMETLHVSDSWLRSIEPSRADRENQKLKQQLEQHRATQPEFEVEIELPDGEPILVKRIEELSDIERDNIHRTIHKLNPQKSQQRDPFDIMSEIGGYDSSYEGRFDAYRKRIPTFMANYAPRLERLFNQARFSVKVVNSGKLQAENLLVEVRVSNGWLHDRYVFVSPQGPTSPNLEKLPLFPVTDFGPMIPARVRRHEFEFKEEPDCSSSFSVTCEDFRHGQEWSFEGIVGLDARAEDSTMISVAVTASNYRGTANLGRLINRSVEAVHISDVVDLDDLKVTVRVPLQKAIESENFKDGIDWEAFDKDD